MPQSHAAMATATWEVSSTTTVHRAPALSCPRMSPYPSSYGSSASASHAAT